MIRFLVVGLALLILPTLFLPPIPKHSARAAAQAVDDYSRKDARIGQVSSIAIDPHDPAIFYAASARGIFKSTDAAETWESIGSGMTSDIVFRKVLVDPNESNVLYAESDTSLLKSADGGASWISVAGELGGGPFHGLTMNSADPSVLYVASQRRIFRTVDGGHDWSAISSEAKERLFPLLVDPQTPNVLYALSDERGLKKSYDAGLHWTKIGPRVPPNDITTLVMSPADSSVLYLGTDKNGIYESNNRGRSWSARKSGLVTKNQNELQGEVPQVWTIAVDPSDPKTVYAGVSANLTGGTTATIFKTADSGEHWRLLRVLGRATGSYGVSCLLINPFNHDVVLGGADGDGIYKSTDGGANWSPEDADLSTADVVAFDIGKSDGALYAATMEGVFRFEGRLWRQVGFSSRDFRGEWVATVAVDPTNSAVVYAGTRSSYDSIHSGLFKTEDGGDTWSEADSELPRLEGYVSALSIDPSDSSTAYAAMFSTGFMLDPAEAAGIKAAEKSGISIDLNVPPAADPSLTSAIYKTTNGGKGWGPWSSGIPRHEMSATDIFYVPQGAATLYALTPPFLWKLTEGGSSWALAAKLPNSSSPRLIFRSPAFAISPSNPLLMYLADVSIENGKEESEVLESKDGGLNWLSSGNSLETEIDHLAVDPRNPATIYADNRDNGILKSTDGGRTWTGMNSGLPHPVKPPLGFQSKTRLTGLALDPIHTDTIYITTGGRGVFVSTDSGSTWQSEPRY